MSQETREILRNQLKSQRIKETLVTKKPEPHSHRQYKVVELANKMKCVLIHDPFADLASVAVSVRKYL
jgi:secreted Zn-dependent insulinase-like peptidase